VVSKLLEDLIEYIFRVVEAPILELPWRWSQNVSPKRYYLSTTTHGVISQRTRIGIIAATVTSNVAQ